MCDNDSKSCMYGTCDNCKDNRLPTISHEAECREVTYSQWVTTEKEFTKRSGGAQETRQVKVTVKESREITIEELYLKFETELKPRFTKHFHLRSLKELMCSDEITVHVDFSENYFVSMEKKFKVIILNVGSQKSAMHQPTSDLTQSGQICPIWGHPQMAWGAVIAVGRVA